MLNNRTVDVVIIVDAPDNIVVVIIIECIWCW
jgi:hypothetical protein